MSKNISGVGVALITPFAQDSSVDYNALERVINHVIDGGVDYLVALGTTAETATLTADERKRVAAFIKEKNNSRLPLVIGVGGNNTAEVVRTLQEFDLSGYDAILSVTPYYNKPSQRGLYEHYKEVAANSPLPLILYNVPSRTGVNMTAETTLKLAKEVGNILGIKEAGGSLSQMCYILRDRPKGFKVICGDDSLAVALQTLGGDGVISVAANAFPSHCSRMMKAVDSCDRATAARINLELLEATDALFEEGNPVGVKAALNIKGIVENKLRLPLVHSSVRLYDKLKKLIADYDL